VTLGGCSGFSTGGDEAAADPDTLRFTLWGADSEVVAFQSLADAFRQRENVTIELNNVPFGEVRQNVDAGLQSGRAPDLFRVTYNDVGVYGRQGALLELDQYLPAGYADAFTPALWTAVTSDGKVVGVPHHTDTSMILYNKAALSAAGVTEIPASPDDAWTQEEFLDVARRVQGQAGTKYAFGVNWQKAGAYRWLNWVFSNGGRLLTPDLTAAAIDSDAGREALRLTQSFFTSGLVPPATSTKGTYVDEVFPSGTIAMVFAGDFLLSGLDPLVKFDYGATFLPVGQRAAADLGGNAVVATKDTKNAEAAAKFLQFLADEQNMADFCARTNVLPTRTALAGKDLSFADRPDLMKLYVQQAQAIHPDDVAQVTVPQFSAINNVLVEQLERAFVDKTDVNRVIGDMAEAVTQQLK